MAGNVINISFNEDLPIGSTLALMGLYSSPGGNVSLNPVWNWVSVRDGAYKASTGTPTLIAGERTAINFVTAFNLDMNGTNQHQVSRVGNQVTIISLYGTVSGYSWDNGYSFLPGGIAADIKFTFSINNNTTPFNITNIEFLEHNTLLQRCGKVRVRITTNINMASISSPVYESGINSTTYTFVYPRGSAGTIIVTSTQTEPITINQTFISPPLLSPNNFTVNVNNSPNGATLIITSVNSQGLILNYALVPPNTSPAPGAYQTSNIYSGIAPGTYWMYFKDQFGCVKYQQFTVAEFGNNRLAYFYISKSMSLRFANRINFSDAGNYKTDENTLSCEVDVRLPYKEIQQFQTGDVITTQFKSNYTDNTATIIKADGTEIDVPVIQKTNNIGVKDKRDGTKISLGNGQTGFYFMSGNIYDYDTDVITGTHALNGTLPIWASFGNYFQADGVWYLVSDIIYSDDLNADIIVVDGAFSGTPETVVIGSIFDLQNYEVYEFTIDFVDYQDQNIKVRINNDDVNFGSLVHLSEKINVKVRQQGTIEIRYYNSENTDVFYATGIRNLIRIPIGKQTAVPNEEMENYKTDTTVKLLSAEIYEMDKFTFLPVTKEIMRKIVQAVSHEIVQMDSVYYVINSAPEFDEAMGVSNLYVLNVTMVKTGGVFTNAGTNEFDFTNVEIPGLIDIGNGSFIEYQG